MDQSERKMEIIPSRLYGEQLNDTNSGENMHQPVHNMKEKF